MVRHRVGDAGDFAPWDTWQCLETFSEVTPGVGGGAPDV